MWEYRVVHRSQWFGQAEASIQTALTSYARDGWEYVNLIRDDGGLFRRRGFVIVFRRRLGEETQPVPPPPGTSGRPTPPSRRP